MQCRIPATAAMLSAALAVVTPTAAQQPARGIIIGAQTPPSSLDPHYHNTTQNNAALGQIFERLFELTPRGTLEPRLAERVRALDDTTWEVTLRAGVRFHDGTPFEADDIAWTYARIPQVANSPALFTAAVRTITAVEVKDPRTVILRTREPNPMLPADLASPVILSRRVHGAAGQAPATSEFNSGALAIGTGPYRLVSFALGDRMELARNEQYWGPAEPWDRVTFRYIPQPGSRVAALLAGEVDLIDYVPSQDMARLERDARFRLFGTDSISTVYLAPDAMRDTTPFATDNQGRPLAKNPLADRRVREALSLAIPRSAIAQRLYQGQATPADQFAAPAAEHRLEGQPPLAFDPARARALLAEAGYPEGFRLTVHGPVNFFPSDDNLLQAVAQSFTRVGVETQIQTLPGPTLFTRATNREFSMFITFFSSWYAINPIRQVVMTRDPVLGFGPFNRTRYSNPAVDRPAAEALVTMDEERRRALTHEAIRAMMEDKAVIPVVVLRYAWAGRRDRVTYEASPGGWTTSLYARPVP
ncbi:ABC transporter substrate-binding protein [Siccirubricoccus deserti]|uniref:ABC transporter substrate-binding protein n=1 Tax=Siccirubricoccus deserti TaxID=2013562 RepID=A0A9X0UGJ8_9PROT|nr:ABC transporter substrate-binding protein [Siccirubricoccus deserti]MBC4019003.1 ABC transporter substrate-binding protein [Siccirubricoccus deserti]GGC70216.1 ABC transporter substrate-binding protein [Siccirubricoccus deserti]